MMTEGSVTALYHAVNRKVWFHLYFVILVHLITEKENTVFINMNLQSNVQNIKPVCVLKNPCVLNTSFLPRKSDLFYFSGKYLCQIYAGMGTGKLCYRTTRFYLYCMSSIPSALCFPWKHSPPGEPSGGVVYLRIVLSPEQASHLWLFLNNVFLQGGLVSTSPKPQAGGPPIVGFPRLLIEFIRIYPPYRRPFLYPQPEDAPCRGDRDPLHSNNNNNNNNYYYYYYYY